MPDRPWVEHAWLTDAAIAVLYDRLGLGSLGPILFFGIVTAGAWLIAAQAACAGPASRWLVCVFSL